MNGDRCIAARIELARYLAIPTPARPTGVLLQGFAGLDGGQIWNVGNTILPSATQGWSSLSVGARALRGDTIAEVAVTRVLNDFQTTVAQDNARLWLRLGTRF